MSRPQDDPDAEMPLTHLDQAGRARMVDVGGKESTVRRARARGRLELPDAVRDRLLAGDLPKGEALGVARVAGIQAAKETARWIPLCHPLPLSSVTVEFRPGRDAVEIEAEASCTGPTGVEMEALVAVSAAALTLYDMVKGLHRGCRIAAVELVEKSGGRSGHWVRDDGDGP